MCKSKTIQMVVNSKAVRLSGHDLVIGFSAKAEGIPRVRFICVNTILAVPISLI